MVATKRFATKCLLQMVCYKWFATKGCYKWFATNRVMFGLSVGLIRSEELIPFPDVDAIAKIYDPNDKKYEGLSDATLMKRAHSIGYDHTRKYYKQRYPAMAAATINMKAQQTGTKTRDAWKALFRAIQV